MQLRYFFLSTIFVFAFAIFPDVTFAASLSVTPDTTTVHVGDTVGVTIYLDAKGGSVNASDGELSFSPDVLTAQSVAYGNSIFSMWAQEPSINSGAGSVSWSGGSNAPFSGSHGRVVRIVFLAKKVGKSDLLLPSSSVYADDGLGTNIGTTPGTSSLTVVASPVPAQVPGTPPVATTETNSAKKIVVTSPTHPQQDMWYASTTARLVWTVPQGATAVRTLLSTREGSAPTISYKPPITEKLLASLDDGIQYFMIRGQYAEGMGPITSYRLQIDTTPPILTASSVFYDATSSMLSVFASASDATSGIRNYVLTIDSATSTTFAPADVANGSYRIAQTLVEGEHLIRIRVIDVAGNSTESAAFTIVVTHTTPLQHSWFAWLLIFSWRDWLLLLLLVLILILSGTSLALWTRLRLHERRFGRGIDLRKIRTLTVSQLLGFKKEVASEIRVLDRAHLRRDITIEEDDEIKKMRHHLAELETFIKKQIDSLEEV